MTAKKAPYLKVLTADPVMRKLIETHDLPRIGKTPIFISLVRAVISQQLSEAAASTIFKRLSSIAEISPENLSILAVDKYRTCGISSRKAEYIMGISEATLDGKIRFIADLSDEDAIKSLVRLKGVGQWTAEMILIFSLGREDVWPCDDAGLLRAAKSLYDVQGADDFKALGERFKPYRSHAAWYLWSGMMI